MKKTITLFSVIVSLFVFGSVSVYAQNDQQIQASATVVSNISLSSSQDVNFGDVEADLNPQPNMNPAKGKKLNVSNNAQFGYLVWSGASGDQVQISGFTSDVTLTGTNNSGSTITYSPQVSAQSGDQSGGSSVGSTTLSSTRNTASFSSSGKLTIWVGGKLTGSSPGSGNTTLPSDTYTGTVSITLNYTM